MKRKIRQCLNCGFKFINPTYKPNPNPYVRALIPICPKCGSDALETVKQKE